MIVEIKMIFFKSRLQTILFLFIFLILAINILSYNFVYARVIRNEFFQCEFYNKKAFRDVIELISSLLVNKKTVVVLIDGDSRVGKTTLSRDITNYFRQYNIITETVHMDDFLYLEYLPDEYTAYNEQHGPIPLSNYNTLSGISSLWDYRKAAQEVSTLAAYGNFNIVILEGLNSGWTDILKYAEFDLKIHVRADFETRKKIYTATYPNRLSSMYNYLYRHVTKYDIEKIDYDLLIDNSKFSLEEE